MLALAAAGLGVALLPRLAIQPEVVELLIAAGADVNERDGSGRTALNVAREAGNADIVRRLIEAGAEE